MSKEKKTVHLFEVHDYEGEAIGVVRIEGLHPFAFSVRMDELAGEYTETVEEGDRDVDSFVEFLVEKGYETERIFLESVQL